MLVLGLIVFVLVAALMPVMIHILNKKGIVDDPNFESERRSHDIPTPRGGGLVIMPVIFGAWLMIVAYVFHWPNFQTALSVVICGAVLCLATWIDDYKTMGLSVKTRLLIQLLAVAIPLIMWPLDQGRLFPHAFDGAVWFCVIERILMAFAWLWFCNLYNFMDGINGISGVEAVSIAGGLLAFCFYGPTNVPLGYPLLLVVIIAAALGFLVWNGRTVAKTFLGDVGSIGFGYCLGFVLFVFAAQGHIVPAALVALVYCMDATATLLKQIWHRKKIWEARREHYYHRATVKGALTHLQLISVLAFVNLLLIGIGLCLLRWNMPPILGLILGIVIVKFTLMSFYYIGYKNGHVSTPRGEMAPWQLRVNEFMGGFFH